MERLIFHRSDVESILRTVQEAGRALAAQRPDAEYLRGYAAALRLTAAAFGVPETMPEPRSQGVEPAARPRVTVYPPESPRSLPIAGR